MNQSHPLAKDHIWCETHSVWHKTPCSDTTAVSVWHKTPCSEMRERKREMPAMYGFKCDGCGYGVYVVKADGARVCDSCQQEESLVSNNLADASTTFIAPVNCHACGWSYQPDEMVAGSNVCKTCHSSPYACPAPSTTSNKTWTLNREEGAEMVVRFGGGELPTELSGRSIGPAQSKLAALRENIRNGVYLTHHMSEDELRRFRTAWTESELDNQVRLQFPAEWKAAQDERCRGKWDDRKAPTLMGKPVTLRQSRQDKREVMGVTCASAYTGEASEAFKRIVSSYTKLLSGDKDE